jgi:hypothetical protein
LLVFAVAFLASTNIEARSSTNAKAFTEAVGIAWNNTDFKSTISQTTYVGPKTTSPRIVTEYGDSMTRSNLNSGPRNISVLPRPVIEYADAVHQLRIKPVQSPTIAPRIRVEYADYVGFVSPVNFYPGPRPTNATIPTKVQCSVSPNPVDVGKSVTLLGNLTRTDINVPIPSATITILLSNNPVGTLKTNSTGWFKAVGQVQSPGSYSIKCSFAGTTMYINSSCSTTLIVTAKTEIYARFFPNPASPGATTTLKGILVTQFSTPIQSATISLQYSADWGVTWNSLGTVATNSYGIFSKTLTAPTQVGTYIYRMTYAGSPTLSASTADALLAVR